MMNMGSSISAYGRLTSLFMASVAVALLATHVLSAQTPIGVNLLVNGGFSSGTTANWTGSSPTAVVVPYGGANTPSNAVATVIGGGTLLLQDSANASSSLEQIVNLVGVPTGTNLQAGGYFGGTGNDDARLVVRFRNSSGAIIAQKNLPWVTGVTRNFESVLMLRDEIMTIPPGTASVVARIEFLDNCCSTDFAAADEIYLILTPAPLIPAAVPMNSQLLANPGFDAGWAPNSPLTLIDARGWEGTTTTALTVQAYANSSTVVPSATVSCLIGGGANPATNCIPGGAGSLLYGGASNNTGVVQRIDVRGNTSTFAPFPTVALAVSAFLGGANSNDYARVDVRFLDGSGIVLGPIQSIGPVTDVERNFEPVVVKREALIAVPATTATIEIEVAFIVNCCGTSSSLADNISAMLVPYAPPVAVQRNTNLIHNSSFSAGSLPGSPIDITDSLSWRGAGNAPVVTRAYGQGTNAPSTNFATANGLGGQLLGGGPTTGNAPVIRQTIDLSADQSAIAAGRLYVYASAWLGGVGSNPDNAEVHLTFQNFAGTQVGLFQQLGPVTNTARVNLTTLIQQTANFQIPAGATQLVVDLQFNDFCCGASDGLADEINVTIYDILGGGPVLYPGTNEDLHLFTGVNMPPVTGVGTYVQTAVAGDVLNVRVASPLGVFDFAPLVLVANAAPTNTPLPAAPFGFPAGLIFNPFAGGSFFIMNGVGCFNFGCPFVVPGGTNYNFAIPAGLTGTRIVLQALAVPLPSAPFIPTNGLFAGSEGHEIRL